jgi:preprotein translocase subunit SecE
MRDSTALFGRHLARLNPTHRLRFRAKLPKGDPSRHQGFRFGRIFRRRTCWRKTDFRMENGFMAKTSPGEFIRQVRAETAKVAWPTSRETGMTVVMVIIMTSILGLFFLGVDSVFSWIVKSLLALAS